MSNLYVLIDYADKAKKFCSSGYSNLRLYYYVKEGNQTYLIREEFFSEARIKELRKNGIPVIDVSQKSFMLNCLKEPRNFIFLARARWSNE